MYYITYGENMNSFKNSDLAKLLDIIKLGDAFADHAFSELVLRYTPLLRARIAMYSFSESEYSEAMQEASIALHSAALTYDSDKCDGVTFGLYAGVCVSNRLKSLLRKNARDSQDTDLTSETEKISSGHDVESYIATRDLCERVMRVAKGILSDFEFEVFRMGFERYSTKDIAESLGRTPKSIDNAKWRISRRLRESREICDILSDIY